MKFGELSTECRWRLIAVDRNYLDGKGPRTAFRSLVAPGRDRRRFADRYRFTGTGCETSPIGSALPA